MTQSIQEKVTVLVVDGDPTSVEKITFLLEKAGYGVIAAPDGRRGVAMARQYRPGLILLHVLLPDMSGIDACRQLMGDHAFGGIPVIFVAAQTTGEVLAEAFNVGGKDFVRTPIDRVELLTRIGRVLQLQKSMQKPAADETLKGALKTAADGCHKLTQPLQYVLGAIQILMMEISPEDPTYTKLDTIREKIEQMGDIARELAEITRYRVQAPGDGSQMPDMDTSAGGRAG